MLWGSSTRCTRSREMDVSVERLAREACEIEIQRLNDPIGKQDQYIAAYGGMCQIRFNQDETVFVDPVVCSRETKEALQENLLMFYTGMTRRAGDILEVQKATTGQKMDVLTAMRDLCEGALDDLAGRQVPQQVRGAPPRGVVAQTVGGQHHQQ